MLWRRVIAGQEQACIAWRDTQSPFALVKVASCLAACALATGLAASGATQPVKVPSTFASGFVHPLAVAVDARNGLLVADHGRGVVYRIQQEGKP